MSIYFEELDYRSTPLGALSLRRRRDLTHDRDIYEIKLGDEFLMSSLFTVSEIALARIGLAECSEADLDIAIGGLGLGYTAQAALDHAGVRSLVVVEALDAVIAWHEDGMLPVGPKLKTDPRCQLVCGDFFAMAESAEGFDPTNPGRRFSAVLVDIDHSPRNVLHQSHATFYEPDGMRQLTAHLKPGGIFALWSNDPPDAGFEHVLGDVFAKVTTHLVTFHNPIQNRDASNTIYLACMPAE